jgi:hypothetical protein
MYDGFEEQREVDWFTAHITAVNSGWQSDRPALQ